ncbi:helix-hairpin-helix domain-containing protein [Konateibacter massiliensis]|uniref:helix-hairpin-helix domain-containing protein n=1 Tax=Konateibacter massiliensis TaxID=2002841 RepID=UPI000C154610|nr:helix-hairpin-helix domain-containing protein [Konateibacter massiliensis]
MRKDKILKFSIIAAIFVLCGFLYSCKDNSKTAVSLTEETADTGGTAVETASEEEQDKNEKTTVICVYICGEVQNPGVYEVEEGARLYQVVELAGGILDTASRNYLNLAECVTDGQKVMVPTEEEAEQLETAKEEAASGLVNINTANEEGLTTLPGIGAAKAKSIIAYRESKGGFQSIEELMEIEGIKEGVFNKVKDLITVK